MHAWFIRSGHCPVSHRLPGFSFLSFMCLTAVPFNNPLLLHCYFLFFLFTLSQPGIWLPRVFASCFHDWLLSCPLLSPAFLSWGTCCSGSSCSCPLGYTLPASFYLSLDAFIHLHGFSNSRMPDNLLLLLSLPRITCALTHLFLEFLPPA